MSHSSVYPSSQVSGLHANQSSMPINSTTLLFRSIKAIEDLPLITQHLIQVSSISHSPSNTTSRRWRHPTFGLRKRRITPLYTISPMVLKAPGPLVTLIYISGSARITLIIYLPIFELSILVLPRAATSAPVIAFSTCPLAYVPKCVPLFVCGRSGQSFTYIGAQEGNRRQVPIAYSPLPR